MIDVSVMVGRTCYHRLFHFFGLSRRHSLQEPRGSISCGGLLFLLAGTFVDVSLAILPFRKGQTAIVALGRFGLLLDGLLELTVTGGNMPRKVIRDVFSAVGAAIGVEIVVIVTECLLGCLHHVVVYSAFIVSKFNIIPRWG